MSDSNINDVSKLMLCKCIHVKYNGKKPIICSKISENKNGFCDDHKLISNNQNIIKSREAVTNIVINLLLKIKLTNNINIKKSNVLELFEFLTENIWFVMGQKGFRESLCNKLIEIESDGKYEDMKDGSTKQDEIFIKKIFKYKKIFLPELYDNFVGNDTDLISYYMKKLYNINDNANIIINNDIYNDNNKYNTNIIINNDIYNDDNKYNTNNENTIYI